MILYANGFGPTSSPAVGGELTQSGSLPVLPVVSIGGISATVQFAGLVSPGLFQFNVVVPAVAQSGDNILSATYKGLTTQSGVVLAVDSPPAQVTLKSLTVNPTSVTGGQSAIGTITLSGPAPTGGVDLQVVIGSFASVAIRVAAGQTSATFPVTTSSTVTSSQTATITATYAGVTLTATLTINPPAVTLASLGLSNWSVTGGSSMSGLVQLSGSAPTGGVLVTLRSSGSAVSVPSSVAIAAGLSFATFPFTTSAVTSTQTITITASLGSVSKTATLTVNPPPASPWALATYTLDGTLTVEGQTEHVQIGSQKPFSWSGPNDYLGTILNQEIASIKVATNIIFDKGASATGNTITYTGVDSTSSTYLNFSRGALEPVISGTMTLTLSAAKVGAAVSGTINFATTARTLTATFTGTVQSID